MNRSGRSDPSGPAITPQASSGDRREHGRPSRRPGRLGSPTRLFTFHSNAPGKQVPVRRYSGDRLGGQHADQHRPGQAVRRGGPYRGDQGRLRRHRRRGLSGPRPTSMAPVASANTVSPSSGVWHAGWCGPARHARRRRRGGTPPAQRGVGGHHRDRGVERAELGAPVGVGGDLVGRRRDQAELFDLVRPAMAARWPGRRRHRPR